MPVCVIVSVPAVRIVERGGDRIRVMHGFVNLELLLPVETFAEGFAFDAGHHIEEESVRLPRVEQQEINPADISAGRHPPSSGKPQSSSRPQIRTLSWTVGHRQTESRTGTTFRSILAW